VTWVREMPTSCGDHKLGTGCTRSTRDYGKCIITAPENAPDHVLGHELRHCFGYEHAADVRALDAARKR
jgi:hypothetical protein